MADSRSVLPSVTPVPAPSALPPSPPQSHVAVPVAQLYWVNRALTFARRLASGRITRLGVTKCGDCGREQIGSGIHRHADGCSAGQVLDALDKIGEIDQDVTPAATLKAFELQLAWLLLAARKLAAVHVASGLCDQCQQLIPDEASEHHLPLCPVGAALAHVERVRAAWPWTPLPSSSRARIPAAAAVAAGTTAEPHLSLGGAGFIVEPRAVAALVDDPEMLFGEAAESCALPGCSQRSAL